MKLPVLILSLGVLFFAICIGVLIYTSSQKPEAAAVLEVATEDVSTSTDQSTITFTEEGRQPSVPANASGAAPVCDRGIADSDALRPEMQDGNISPLTKESVIQALIKRNTILSTGSADCIREYLDAGALSKTSDWNEFRSYSDEKLLEVARAMGAASDTNDPSYFRTRVYGSSAVWTVRDSQIEIGFRTEAESIVSYQVAYLSDGSWF